jgi:hypothetical protein
MSPTFLPAFLLVAAISGHCLAQNATDADNARANEAGATIVSHGLAIDDVALMFVASKRCGYGDPADWMRVVDAIDRRYWFCATQDPYWPWLARRHFEKQLQQAYARGSSTGLGSLAFDFVLPTATRQFEAAYASGGCSSFSKSLLEADVSSPVHVRQLFALGKDQGWINAPCDAFHPAQKN